MTSPLFRQMITGKEYRGIHRIQEETGIDVHRILDVSIAGDKTQVTYDRYVA